MSENKDLGSAAVAAPRPSAAESIAWARDVLKTPTMKRPTVAELEALLSDTKPPPIQIKADGSIEIAHFPEAQHIANLLEEIERWPQLGVIEVMIRNPAVDEWVREKEAEIERLHASLRKLRSPPTVTGDADTISAVMDLHELQCAIIQNLDQCATDLNMGKKGTKITFGTEQRIGLKGTEQLGLVLWLDRKAVADIIADSKAEGGQ
jgi:hypothetical protein